MELKLRCKVGRPRATGTQASGQNGEPCSGSGVSGQLWSASQPEVYRALYHPFVRALADGSLPRSVFQHYIAQDAFFLQQFMTAYDAAVQLATTQSPGIVAVLLQLKHGAEGELEMHGSYAEEWGVDLSAVQPSKGTLAYTSFLHQTAAEAKHVSEILAAVVPCLRLYAFLGLRLSAAHPGPPHAYTHWMDTYSSLDYCALPAAAEHALDNAQPADLGECLGCSCSLGVAV